MRVLATCAPTDEHGRLNEGDSAVFGDRARHLYYDDFGAAAQQLATAGLLVADEAAPARYVVVQHHADGWGAFTIQETDDLDLAADLWQSYRSACATVVDTIERRYLSGAELTAELDLK